MRENIYLVSKRLPTNYLLFTKGKEQHFNTGEIWWTPPKTSIQC